MFISSMFSDHCMTKMSRDAQHKPSSSTPSYLQQSEPVSPKSPQSISSSEVLRSAHSVETANQVHPVTLHLQPVTWESLSEITFPPGERFEVVDGLLEWVQMSNGSDKHQRIISGLVRFFNVQPSWWAISCLDVEVASTSGNLIAPNARSPDVVITRRRPGSPTGSSSSEGQQKKHVLLKKNKPAHAQVEVTSESTRTNDLTTKWLQYYHTGVKFYYIIDLYGKVKWGKERVIVGSTEKIQDWSRCDNGNPDGASSSSASSSQPSSNSYYKKVFSGNEQVNVGVFRDQPLTASQLVSFTVLYQKAEEIKQRNDNLSKENAAKDLRIAMLEARLQTLQESPSKSNASKQRKNSNTSAHRESTPPSSNTPASSPANSPVKKKHKRHPRRA